MASHAELETQIAQAVAAFAKEFLGRGPLVARAYCLDDDLVLVRCRGPLTVLEHKQTTTKPSRSNELARRLRRQAIEIGRESLEVQIGSLTGQKVRAVLTDVCVQAGESVFVFVLEKPAAGPNQAGSVQENA